MRVYCVDNKDVSLSVTVGNWYEVSPGDPVSDLHSYLIVKDGKFSRISKSKFLTIEQIREKKLKILGI